MVNFLIGLKSSIFNGLKLFSFAIFFADSCKLLILVICFVAFSSSFTLSLFYMLVVFYYVLYLIFLYYLIDSLYIILFDLLFITSLYFIISIFSLFIFQLFFNLAVILSALSLLQFC